MVTKNQAIEIIKDYVLQLQDTKKVNRCNDVITRLNSMSDEEFDEIVRHTLGEKSDLDTFNNWLITKLKEPELQGIKFVQLNDFVSYHLAGTSKDTISLHVVPTHVTNSQIRSSGSYLVDALEKLKVKIRDGEFEEVKTIFAVSDILKIKKLQGYFRDLGFNVAEGEERFRGRFKNPYQVSLSKSALMSEEWEELKEKFMKGRTTISELESKDELEK